MIRYELLLRDEKEITAIVDTLKKLNIQDVKVHPFTENVIHIIFYSSNHVNLSSILNNKSVSRCWITENGKTKTILTDIDFEFE